MAVIFPLNQGIWLQVFGVQSRVSRAAAVAFLSRSSSFSLALRSAFSVRCFCSFCLRFWTFFRDLLSEVESELELESKLEELEDDEEIRFFFYFFAFSEHMNHTWRSLNFRMNIERHCFFQKTNKKILPWEWGQNSLQFSVRFLGITMTS